MRADLLAAEHIHAIVQGVFHRFGQVHRQFMVHRLPFPSTAGS
jgi:hypothetical protein